MSENSYKWEDPVVALQRLGLQAKRRYSQNFLRSPHAVERIAALTKARADCASVVELGPGLGTLTRALACDGRPLFAVDADPEMIDLLRTELREQSHVAVQLGDAADLDFSTVPTPHPLAVVGNLPYAITGSIFRNLVEQHESVPFACFMVQREVAERLNAAPRSKDYGALTVFTSAVYATKLEFTLKPTAFVPPPKVHSAVVTLSRRAAPLARLDSTFTRIVRAAFQGRRKMLRRSLLTEISDATTLAAVLSEAQVDPTSRADAVAIIEYERIAAAVRAL